MTNSWYAQASQGNAAWNPNGVQGNVCFVLVPQQQQQQQQQQPQIHPQMQMQMQRALPPAPPTRIHPAHPLARHFGPEGSGPFSAEGLRMMQQICPGFVAPWQPFPITEAAPASASPGTSSAAPASQGYPAPAPQGSAMPNTQPPFVPAPRDLRPPTPTEEDPDDPPPPYSST